MAEVVVKPVAEQLVTVSQEVDVIVAVAVPDMLAVKKVVQLVAVACAHDEVDLGEVDVGELEGSSVSGSLGSGSVTGGDSLWCGCPLLQKNMHYRGLVNDDT